MKPSLWKVLQSYLYDVTLERITSDMHSTLTVSLSHGRYQLNTPNAIYSYGDLYENFTRSFEQLNWQFLPGNQVLLLGLGLGSIPYMLETSFNKDFNYTAVEKDPHVIHLAQKYVLSSLKSPITVYEADALVFVESTNENWDMICVDIFIDDQIPAQFQTRDFLEDLASRLTPDGVILYNWLSRTESDIEQTSEYYERVFLKVFPGSGVLEVGGNWVLTSRKEMFGF